MLFSFQQKFFDFIVTALNMNFLMVKNFDIHCDLSSFVRKFKGVGKEVQKYLEEPSLVSMDGLD